MIIKDYNDIRCFDHHLSDLAIIFTQRIFNETKEKITRQIWIFNYLQNHHMQLLHYINTTFRVQNKDSLNK